MYARREEMRLHEEAKRWLVDLAEGSEPWAVPVFCIPEFVRVVTHPRVFRPPTATDGAFAFLDAVLASPTVRLLLPGATFPDRFAEQVRAADARGNLAFDAQIAAVCAESGVDRILTADRDFARFPGLEPLFL